MRILNEGLFIFTTQIQNILLFSLWLRDFVVIKYNYPRIIYSKIIPKLRKRE